MTSDRILVDNNALADLFIGESGFHADAENLRRKHASWVAPPLIRYEFGNVLRTYVRVGRKEAKDSLAMLRSGLGMIRFCEEPLEETILLEAHASGLSYYDATYVTCARMHGLPLYTRDEEILKNCPEVARRISDA
jgi:predicted nucleic acid-binding protein